MDQEAPTSVPPGIQQPPPVRNWTPVVVAGFALAVAIIGLLLWLVLSSRGSPGPLSEKHTIVGALEAPECGGGYDIENAGVEIRNETDKLIGSTTTSSDVGENGCKVTFTVDDVPKASFYQIQIGTHGGPSYTYEEMKSRGWQVDLSLG
jgi:hypothetical protein